MNKIIKYSLFILLMGLLYLPMAEQRYSFFKFSPLIDVEDTAKFPALSWTKYFDLSYEDSVNHYVEVLHGFRPWMVRQYNTLNYSLFHSADVGDVVLGKHHQLFSESYILDYIGQNFIGKLQADEVVRRTVAVQKALKERNIDLIIIFAPGKASFYPEYIPDRYLKMKKNITNYSFYAKAFKENNLNFIDLNAYFKQIKYSSPYALYPQYGTHWSSYGVGVAVDTMIKYINHLRNISLPSFDFSRVKMDSVYRNKDYDLGELLNIDFIPRHDPMPYPEFKFSSSPATQKPEVLAVGDSYWWRIVAAGIPGQIFKRDVYWNYNVDEYINNIRQPRQVSSFCMREFRERIEQTNIIIIISTEATYYMFPYGFIDKAYYLYCASPEEKVKYWINQIQDDPDWIRDLRKKANTQNKPLDEIIRDNAEWCSKEACF